MDDDNSKSWGLHITEIPPRAIGEPEYISAIRYCSTFDTAFRKDFRTLVERYTYEFSVPAELIVGTAESEIHIIKEMLSRVKGKF